MAQIHHDKLRAHPSMMLKFLGDFEPLPLESYLLSLIIDKVQIFYCLYIVLVWCGFVNGAVPI